MSVKLQPFIKNWEEWNKEQTVIGFFRPARAAQRITQLPKTPEALKSQLLGTALQIGRASSLSTKKLHHGLAFHLPSKVHSAGAHAQVTAESREEGT